MINYISSIRSIVSPQDSQKLMDTAKSLIPIFSTFVKNCQTVLLTGEPIPNSSAEITQTISQLIKGVKEATEFGCSLNISDQFSHLYVKGAKNSNTNASSPSSQQFENSIILGTEQEATLSTSFYNGLRLNVPPSSEKIEGNLDELKRLIRSLDFQVAETKMEGRSQGSADSLPDLSWEDLVKQAQV